MKVLRNLVDKVKPNFVKGGKLEKWYPAFEAMETFLFSPGEVTTHNVHIRDAMDLKRTMITVVIAMVPTLLFGIWNTGYQHYLAYGMEMTHMDYFLFGLQKVLPIVVVSYAVGLGVEFIFAVVKGHPVSEGYLVTGMLIPLILPVTIPLWMVALSAIFCTLIGKEIFGGTGMNFMNPALLSRAFLFFAFPAFMSGEIWTDLSPESGQVILDAYSGATNLVTYDVNYQQMQSVSDMFWGFEQGSIGETSVFACLIGAFILILTGVGSWKIMLSVFVGAAAMGLFFNGIAPADDPTHYLHTPFYYHWLMGGFAFGAVYMATDPVTAAHTERGKWVYGLMIGGLIVIIRAFNPAYPEAVMMVILLMNVHAPLIDHIVVQNHIKKRLRRAIQQ